jgi:hypothetical protein
VPISAVLTFLWRRLLVALLQQKWGVRSHVLSPHDAAAEQAPAHENRCDGSESSPKLRAKRGQIVPATVDVNPSGTA